MKFVQTIEELWEIYKKPGENAVRKELNALDFHARNFIDRSPFVLIGSQDHSGNADVTPKGDLPGFVSVLDDVTLAIPDRPGNNRLDTWQNIIENPAVGMIFLIPGMAETLRANGEARLTVDTALCERMGVNGRPALSVLIVKVHQVYMHCAKAFIRSGLWKPETWPDRSSMPTLGEIMRDQLALSERAEEVDNRLAGSYRKALW